MERIGQGEWIVIALVLGFVISTFVISRINHATAHGKCLEKLVNRIVVSEDKNTEIKLKLGES